MNTPKTEIGQRIKRARLAIGFSQRRFASVLGIAANHLCQIERGHCMPGSRLLHGMHTQFNIDINWLMTGHYPMVRLSSRNMALRTLLHHYFRADEAGKHLLRSTASMLATGKQLPRDAPAPPAEMGATDQGEG